MNISKTNIKIILGVSTILLIPVIASAWTAPTTVPPNGNVEAPLNAGASNQSKKGRLTLNTDDTADGLWVYGVGDTKGRVGIGTLTPQYKLDVSGNINYSGTLTNVSDSRLKDNIRTLENSLRNILKIRGVSFTMKDTGRNSMGVIAQELEDVYPNAVNTAADGIKSVNYVSLIGPLIEAIKEQQAEIEALKARVAELEARN